ncbi:hypothetical protein [Burkholderia sp. Ac-20392]|uniref:hypothetical protein n=1 Tax=Burkholderia sp. Ac-20392 TaxID=2703905 RepID=UPI00197E5EFA|nr:hypothetical protein [Burkholderia sp. Ac-20392]MBN3795721.1 hypothetical protein [Burkholderia sp. Ac-20392]
MDTFPEVTPFTFDSGNRGHLARCDCPGGTNRRPTRSIPPRDVERDPAASVRRGPRLRFRIPDNGVVCVRINDRGNGSAQAPCPIDSIGART